jgi:diguanylate cyclase (GGDEF)-like protein/PAS domain S-box-containing protein
MNHASGGRQPPGVQAPDGESRYRQVIDCTSQGFLLLNRALQVVDLNLASERLLGLERGAILGQRCDRFYDRASVAVHAASRDHLTFEAELAGGVHRVPALFSRSRLRSDSGQEAGYALFITDLSEKRLAEENLRRSEQKYRRLSVLDNLTGLYNTRYLYATLAEMLAVAGRSGQPLAVIFMDLDRFKSLVDTHGHLNGSRAIQQVARTLQACLEAPRFAVAYAGDEFVLVLPDTDRAGAVRTAEVIRGRMAASRYLEEQGRAVRISASFGVAAYPDDAGELTDLLAAADRALFAVKRRGRGGVGLPRR